MALDIGTLKGNIELDDELSGALTEISNKLRDFGAKFDNAFGAVAIGAASAVVALGTVTTAIITMGERGSDINDVADTLDHFAGSSQNAAAILDNLRKGTLGTVDDFDLMKSASRLLSANVKLNATDFGTLGQAAFVLQNRGLGGTKQMLDLVSQALITGRTRHLAMALGVIDNSNAAEKYAASIGKTVDKLTVQERALATQKTIMDMMRAAALGAGKVQRDFGENMEAATVAIKNWFDELDRGVAKSKPVMDAMNAIGDAVKQAFGGKSQTLMEAILKWVDRFASMIGTVVPPMITAVGAIADKVYAIYTAVKKGWDDVPDWFKNIAEKAALAGLSVYGVQQAIGGLTGADITGTIASYATIWSGFGKAVALSVVSLREWTALLIAFKGEAVLLLLDKIKTVIAGFFVSYGPAILVTAAITALLALAQAIGKAYDAWKSGRDMWDYFLGKTQPEDMDFLTRNVRELGYAITGWEKLHDVVKKTTDAMPTMSPIPSHGLTPMRPVSSHGDNEAATDGTPSSVDKSFRDMVDQMTGKKMQDQINLTARAYAQAKKEGGLWATELEKLGKQLVEQSAQIKVMPPELIELYEQTATLTLKMKEASVESLKFSDAVKVTKDTLTSGAVPALKAQATALDKVFESIRKITQLPPPPPMFSKESIQHSKDMSAALVVVGGLIDDIGRNMTGTGRLITAAFSSMINIAKDYQNAMTAAKIASNAAKTAEEAQAAAAQRAAAASSAAWATATLGISLAVTVIAGMYQHAKQAKAEIADLQNQIEKLGAKPAKLPVVGGDAKHYGEQIELLQGQLENLKARQEATNDAMSAFGLTTDDIGSAADKAKNHIRALSDQFEYLHEAGFSVATITEAGKDKLNELIATSLQAGTKLPAALQPYIEQLIKSKGLTDDNAKALLGLSDDGMPALADIKDAAERYGLTLDQLGPKVMQLDITDRATQIAKDLKTFQDAGADMGVVFTGAGDKIQALVSDALRFGADLPESMKPFLQSMVDAGRLTDENGVKLTDLSKFNFTKPLQDMVQALIDKMGELIDRMLDVGSTVIPPFRVPIVYEFPDLPSGSVDPSTGLNDNPDPSQQNQSQIGGESTPQLRGGTRGTFPDWGLGTLVTLHGRERVMTEAEQNEGSGVTITVPVSMDGRVVATAVARYIPDALKAAGK
jgi:hypothetical protein